ncbi:hypothetical protein [Bacillus thuringiensis]|nr:hypothetical protein [Bacillus thuringiensis]HEB2439597.1 hypothetical protein [Bacillus thuringiensis]
MDEQIKVDSEAIKKITSEQLTTVVKQIEKQVAEAKVEQEVKYKHGH